MIVDLELTMVWHQKPWLAKTYITDVDKYYR